MNFLWRSNKRTVGLYELCDRQTDRQISHKRSTGKMHSAICVE